MRRRAPIPWSRLLIFTTAVGAVAVAVALFLTAGDGDLLGQTGQWVTRPDGRKVCQLARPLTLTSKVDAGFCENWQEPEPRRGEPVEGWVRTKPEGGYQIMIEGTWRP